MGVTIAHGLYTLSLGPRLSYEIYELRGQSLGLNYGYEQVRYLSPVKVGCRFRMTQELTGADPIEGGFKLRSRQTFGIQGQERPARVAEALSAYFY